MLQQKRGALNVIPWTSIVAQTLEARRVARCALIQIESRMASLY
jgi:hypothetical protein